ncbi:unnamed protein product [Candidula unifasciata]|uniref:SOCS box domain-containing protein n=1 Tax=Candidula unifasciata TaxID=100452 RepID=A0A8S3ZAE3_9EUPU|nr:unnamed protein product [Candidula unifasciata]
MAQGSFLTWLLLSRMSELLLNQTGYKIFMLLKSKGLNLKIFLDDLNNTPLILASHLGLENMMTYIVLNEPSLHEEDIIATATEILHKLAHTRDTSFLGHLNTLVQCWNSRNSVIPYTFIVQAAFKILRAPPKDLLASFCENALKLMPDLSQDISLKLVLYEETECYWKILHEGMHLNDLWPINCEENRYSKYYTTHSLFNIYFNYSCLFTIHTSGRNKITKITIQAANGPASPSVLYVIQNFPTDLYDDVFKYLILAGFKMPPADIQRMANVEIDKAAELIRWYKQFYSQPHKLKHLCRLCVRQNLQYNVIYSLRQLLLPQDLYQYLLLGDVCDYEYV